LVMFRILKRNEIWWSFLSHAWFLRLNSEIRCIIRQDSADPVRFTLQTAYKQRPAVLLLLVCVDCTFSRTSWKRQVHRHAKKVKVRRCIKPNEILSRTHCKIITSRSERTVTCKLARAVNHASYHVQRALWKNWRICVILDRLIDLHHTSLI
jgi:hypothetical protein